MLAPRFKGGFEPAPDTLTRHAGDRCLRLRRDRLQRRPGAALDALNESIKVEAGDLKLLGVMANIWFDIDTGSAVLPYLGGGVGLGHITLDSRSRAQLGEVSIRQVVPESSASAFAFQAGAGLGYEIGVGVTFSLGYRLYGTTEAELPWNAVDTDKDEVLKASVLHHNVDLGIGFRF